jgi:hypothetical protein
MRRLELLKHMAAAGLPVAAISAALCSLALAQSAQPRPQLREPVYRVPRALPAIADAQPLSGARSPRAATAPVASQPIRLVQATEPVEQQQQQPQQQPAPAAAPAAAAPNSSNPLAPENLQPQPGEHPLMPALRLAKYGVNHIDTTIKDYSCTLVKRERIGDTLGDHEYIFTKVRHEPFSVYMFFLGPATMKGREVVFVNGANNNKLTAHEGGKRGKLLPTVQIEPTSFLAMRNQRYPITEVGVRTLTSRLIEVAEKDSQFGECEVKFFKGAKINGRVATCIEVAHPVPRQNFLYHQARIFIDEELQIPVRFESYAWPARAGEQPPLLEEYTYMNMKLNNGFTDADFSDRNPEYNFHR